jgi:hypothetical protein
MLRPTLTKCCGESSARGYSVDRPAAQYHATSASPRVLHQQSTGVSATLAAQTQLTQSTLSSLLQQNSARAGMEQQHTASVWPQGHLRQLKGRQQPRSSASRSAVQRHGLHMCTRPPCRGWATKHHYICTLVRLGHDRAGPHMAPVAAAMRAFGERTTCAARQGVSCCGTAGVERMAMPGAALRTYRDVPMDKHAGSAWCPYAQRRRPLLTNYTPHARAQVSSQQAACEDCRAPLWFVLARCPVWPERCRA